MACHCEWIFGNIHDVYLCKLDKIYIINRNNNNTITTLKWHAYLYCDKCHGYVCNKNLEYRYPITVSLSLKEHLIDDIRLYIMAFYHHIK